MRIETAKPGWGGRRVACCASGSTEDLAKVLDLVVSQDPKLLQGIHALLNCHVVDGGLGEAHPSEGTMEFIGDGTVGQDVQVCGGSGGIGGHGRW